MKILIINHIYLEYDLSSTTQLSITKSLNKLGHKTILYVPSLTKRTDQYVKRIQLPSRNAFLSSPIFNLKLFLVYPALLNKEKPDVIMVDHLTYPSAIPYIIAARLHLLKTSFIFDVRSQPVSLIGVSGKLRHWQYIWAMKAAKYTVNNFTFLTPLMAEEQCRLVHINPDKKRIGFWGCGVDEDIFDPQKYTKTAEKLKTSLGIKEKFIVFYHGVLAPNRGLDNTIRAMSKARELNKDIVFFMLGDGPQKKELKKIISSEGLEDSVIIHDSVPHKKVPSFIAMADVCIIPLPNHDNWRAQQPIKLAEYLAMKKFVIVTRIPAHINVLEDSQSALWLTTNSPSALLFGIKKAYSERAQLKRKGAGGRRLIEKQFTWDAIASSLIKYLNQVAI